eukprot:2494783-Rhodomonas_salina.2
MCGTAVAYVYGTAIAYNVRCSVAHGSAGHRVAQEYCDTEAMSVPQLAVSVSEIPSCVCRMVAAGPMSVSEIS